MASHSGPGPVDANLQAPPLLPPPPGGHYIPRDAMPPPAEEIFVAFHQNPPPVVLGPAAAPAPIRPLLPLPPGVPAIPDPLPGSVASDDGYRDFNDRELILDTSRGFGDRLFHSTNAHVPHIEREDEQALREAARWVPKGPARTGGKMEFKLLPDWNSSRWAVPLAQGVSYVPYVSTRYPVLSLDNLDWRMY